MSAGWKDTQNFQFGRRRWPPPPPTPPSLYLLAVDQVLRVKPEFSIGVNSPPSFFIKHSCWKSDSNPADPQAGGLEGIRLKNKRKQVDNVLSVMDFLAERFSSRKLSNDDEGARRPHLVEFCASSGYCALPFASKFSEYQVSILDAKLSSIQIAWKRRQEMPTRCRNSIRVLLGRTEDFREDFDIGVALHACGDATDAVLDLCLGQRAAFCLIPCCVGRLSRLALGYHDHTCNAQKGNQCTYSNNDLKITGKCLEWSENIDLEDAQQVERRWKQMWSTMRKSRCDCRPRPRSEVLVQALGGNDVAFRSFAALARAADACRWLHNDVVDDGNSDEEVDTHETEAVSDSAKAALEDSKKRKIAKHIVDWDRLQLAREKGYKTYSFTMEPSTCTPKNDILFGYPEEWDE